VLKIDISKCTGCKKCETTCSFFHTGKINNFLSRIKVLNIYETGIDGPVVCNQCQERYCMSCPEDALTIGTLGQIIVSPTVCNLCGVCEKRCPIGAIEIFNEIVYVCDLCGGNPKCVDACTEGAIIFEKNGNTPSLAELKKKSIKMNPSQKRFLYLSENGKLLRKKWRKNID